MKTNCGVIRDLLPLYAEKMTGEESNALIKEHLAECRECSEHLKKLQSPVNKDNEAVASSGIGSLKLVRKGIRSRKLAAVLFSALLVFTVMLTAFSHIVKPEYISYKDSGVTVTEAGNGDVYAGFSENVTSCRVIRTVNGDGRTVAEIEAWTSLWDELFHRTAATVLISSKTDKADVVYYCDLSTEGDNMTVIYGEAAEENITALPRLVLGYYFLAALIAAVILGLACIIFRKNKKLGRIFGYLFAAPLSYVIAHLIITTRFVSFSATGDFLLNCVAALAIYGVLVCGAMLFRQHRQDTIAG